MLAIVAWANVAVSAGAGGAWTIAKTGGADGAADAGAVSAAAIEGDFVLRARLVSSGTCYAGVAQNPEADAGFASIPNAVQLAGGIGRACELGLNRPPLFAIDGFVWLRRTGSQFEYGTGPDLAGMSVRRSVPGDGGPVRFDSSLLTAGMALEVAIGPPAAFAPARRRPRHGITLGFGL